MERTISIVKPAGVKKNIIGTGPDTIRAVCATVFERNIVHGSDSAESASYEIPFFFSSPETHLILHRCIQPL